jgi:tRNA modification GTPase
VKNDTIAAIATAPGEGGIAIVRVSGPEAIGMVDQVFEPVAGGRRLTERAGYTAGLGWVVDRNGERIDEVLTLVMRAPRSYTAEDVVEVHCHGGVLPARRVLERVLAQGARMADAGEFTLRAFLNGRLDITQAEAVIDLIRAKSTGAMRIAMRQLQGELGRRMRAIEEELIGINAGVEASIDFPEEIGDIDRAEALERVGTLAERVRHILEASERGRVYCQGIRMAIVGKPNVGKSSLLNALLQKNRAIVTDIPGTTRDVIEEYVSLRGIPVRLMDTAGLRETEDVVERLGVERTRQAIDEADVVLFVLDVGAGLDENDRRVQGLLTGKKAVVLVNKDDLEDKRISVAELESFCAGLPLVRASAREGTGLRDLELTVEQLVLGGQAGLDEMELVVNTRHSLALRRVLAHLEAVCLGLQQGVTLDCLAVDLWGALEAMGEITGRVLREDVIERIFHDFCIGK